MKNTPIFNDFSLEGMREVWDEAVPSLSSGELYHALEKVQTRIAARNKWRKVFVRVAVAASLLLIPVLSLYLSKNYVETHVQTSVPRMLQCQVPYGDIREINLPDGSHVTLNAGSMLVYPEKFDDHFREIYLSGEAAFSVEKDPSRPFRVKAADFDVEVLGTVFCVSSYPDAPHSSVVLKEGSVKLLHGEEELYLDVNQRAEYSRQNGAMHLEDVLADDYMVWRNGEICFRKASMETIISTIEKRFGVKVFCSNAEKYTTPCITARFDNFDTLENLLDVLSRLIPGMKYRVEGDVAWLY